MSFRGGDACGPPNLWLRILAMRKALLATDNDAVAEKFEDAIRFWTDELVKYECSGLDAGLQALTDGAFDGD